MKVYALGIVDHRNCFLVKRIYANKADAEFDMKNIKDIVHEFSFYDTVIKEMPIYEKKASYFYTVSVDLKNSDVCIDNATEAPIVPSRSYLYEKVEFSIENTGFSYEDEVKAKARSIAKDLAREIDCEFKKLVHKHVFVTLDPHYKHFVLKNYYTINKAVLVSSIIKDQAAFENDLAKCRYSSTMHKLLNEVVDLLNVKLTNLPKFIDQPFLGFDIKKDFTEKEISFIVLTFKRYHLFDEQGNLAWLIPKIIHKEDILVSDL